jgi:vancomycin resistance protein YoaR
VHTLRRPVVLVAVAVVVAAVLAVVALWTAQRDRVLPNTRLGGVEVGGMTADEAAAAIAPAAREREQEPVAVVFEDDRLELVPDDLGYRIDDEASVEAALARGRTNPVTDVGVRFASLWRDEAVPFAEELDRDELEARVDDLADDIDRDRFTGAVVADPETLEVTVEQPEGAAEVRRDEAVELIVGALRTPGPDEVELPVDVEDPEIPPADVEAVAAQVEEAIAEPFVLRGDDDELTIEPAQLASLIDVGENEDGTTLELEVTEEQFTEFVGEEASEVFDQSPRDATFTAARTPPASFDDMGSTTWSPVEADVGIEPGREGRELDPALAAEAVTTAVRDGERETAVELEITEPEVSDERAEELRPTHLLSTFTTYYQSGQTRNANIQLLADVIDGTTVLPGEQFSVNDISGERDCAKGYQPAGTIVQGELVDTCGGGVSQFGTTTFNAAFFSGLQLDQWQAHSFYISRYPRGREATLSYPALDVRFTNTTDGAVVVRASHTGSSVTVSLYGQPIAASVSASHGEPTDRREPTTETRDSSELPSGQTRTVQSQGSAGFRVEVTRTVELVGGGTDRQVISTTYEPQNGIVERGTG